MSLAQHPTDKTVAWLLGGEPIGRGEHQVVEQLFYRARRTSRCAGIMVVDLDGMIRGCNEVVEHVFQRRPDQLIGTPVQSLLPALALRPSTPGYNLAYLTFWFPPGVFRLCHIPPCDDDVRPPLWVAAEVMRLYQRHHVLITVVAQGLS